MIELPTNEAVKQVVRVANRFGERPGRGLEVDFGQAIAVIPGVLLVASVADFRAAGPVPFLVVTEPEP